MSEQVQVRFFPESLGAEGPQDIAEGATVLDLLRALGLPPDAVVATSEGLPLPMDRILRPGQQLEILGVVSGGVLQTA